MVIQKGSLVDSGVMSSEPNATRSETYAPGHRNETSTQLSTSHGTSIASALSKSKAAKFNTHTLRKLQAAVDKNPEVDLTSHMPINYSVRLAAYREELQDQTNDDSGRKSQTSDKPQVGDIRDHLRASDSVDIIWPLSPAVLRLLEEASETADPLSYSLPQRLLQVMETSEVLWKSPFPDRMMVFKCAADVIVKAVQCIDDDTEYTALQYLERHKPGIPAPRPLGYVRMSGITLIFQTYKASTTLAAVWPQLEQIQKASIRDQLITIMLDLRSIPDTDGTALGGVAGEGCKDIRRHLRKSEKPIYSLGEFEDFLFSGRHSGGQIFVELLRQLYPHQSEDMEIVFTHGDLRPDNITVDMDEQNQWVVTGLLDWEYSGFYPAYCEAFKCTNCITPYEDDDWYLFLPDCISPKRYAHWWLLDRVREARVV